MTMRLMDRALQFAKRGWHIFPLRTGDKQPLQGFTKWESRATTDREQIIRWWTAAPYNIGIAAGPSGLVVIDCDIPRGSGEAHWCLLGNEVEVTGHRLPRTFSVGTPSGGLHLYFNRPDRNLGNTAGRLGKYIDTRGAGGYVVGPGSVCSGRYYTIMDRRPLADLPEWVIDALMPTSMPAFQPSVRQHQDRYLRAVVVGEAQRVRTAAPGSRNNALNVAAFILGQLVGGAELSESEARVILWHAVRKHLGVDGLI